MERRNAVKQIALTMGGLVSLPSWTYGWNRNTVSPKSKHTNEVLLAELVETIIPTTKTLGAKGLRVHQFILTMIQDCYDKNAQINFNKALSAIDPLSIATFGKPFVEGDKTERLNLLKSLPQSSDKTLREFYSTLYNLTIQGYTSSEYYLTKFTNYEMAPGHFYGCVPLKK